ncbi:MAG: RNA polymerase factor sigma-54 [Thermomicrobiales bacterium]
MEMEHGYDLSQEQRPWVSPSLIEANYILSLSRMELENIIAAEVEVNPALEVDEQPVCAMCGAVLEGAVCPTCPVEAARPELPDRDDSVAERLTSTSSLRDDDDFDPLALVADDENVRATILRDARTIVEPDEQVIAEYLVDAIDERGFLSASFDEVAQALGVEVARIETVLEVIQDVAPVGVGSRDLRECLQLQIRELENLGQVVPPIVHAIVDRHLEDLALHKFGKISKEIGVTTEEVEEARDFIRGHLNPTPLQSQLARSWRSPSRSTYVAPDVVISIKDDVLYVEVVDSGRARLRVNPLYEELAVDLGRRRAHRENEEPSPNGHDQNANTETSDDDRTHIRQYTARAKNFLSNVQQRQDTLLRITKCICELQEGFLRDGVRELRALTRATVAQQVGVHESTVSRATADKYVMLPSRKVIPFSDFFTPSLSVKDVMRELIHLEHSHGRSLTDREICDRLQQQGIRIARRTVAKYRNELGILPSTMR